MTKQQTVAEINELLAAMDSREAQLSAMSAQLGLKLDQAEACAGDAFLDGDESVLKEVAELRLQADGVTAALKALDRRRSPLKESRRRAEAAELRNQAESKRKQLAEVNAKTAKLLGQLAQIEGVEFTHSILSSQSAGAWLNAADYTTNPPTHLAAHELVRDTGATFATPLSRKLRAEAEALEFRAVEIEREFANEDAEPAAAEPRPLTPGRVEPVNGGYGTKSGWYRG
jgi:hypothetical protein